MTGKEGVRSFPRYFAKALLRREDITHLYGGSLGNEEGGSQIADKTCNYHVKTLSVGDPGVMEAFLLLFQVLPENERNKELLGDVAALIYPLISPFQGLAYSGIGEAVGSPVKPFA